MEQNQENQQKHTPHSEFDHFESSLWDRGCLVVHTCVFMCAQTLENLVFWEVKNVSISCLFDMSKLCHFVRFDVTPNSQSRNQVSALCAHKTTQIRHVLHIKINKPSHDVSIHTTILVLCTFVVLYQQNDTESSLFMCFVCHFMCSSLYAMSF